MFGEAAKEKTKDPSTGSSAKKGRVTKASLIEEEQVAEVLFANPLVAK